MLRSIGSLRFTSFLSLVMFAAFVAGVIHLLIQSAADGDLHHRVRMLPDEDASVQDILSMLAVLLTACVGGEGRERGVLGRLRLCSSSLVYKGSVCSLGLCRVRVRV